VGKDADVVIWNHHPLSSYAIAERVYIDGQKYYDRLDDQKRMTELAKEKDSLVNAERSERRTPTTTENGSPRPAATTGSSVAQATARRSRAAGAPLAISRLISARAEQARPLHGGGMPITNARIFPIASPPIERGTIVVRDGVIESVGANANVPAGVQVIDAAGADIYPGFIDASTTIGLEDPGAGAFGDADELREVNPPRRAQGAVPND